MSMNYKNPSGFPEYLPDEQFVFDGMIRKLKEIYGLYGFLPLETSSVEYLDTLVSDGEITKEIYSLKRAASEGASSEDKRALHFDLTVPFARYTAQNFNELSFPYKRYQVQKVWRGERPQKGRFREFYQADIDIVGIDNLPISCDAEVVNVIANALMALRVGELSILINNRKFLTGIINGFVEASKVNEVMRVLDKIDKIGVEKVAKIMIEDLDLNDKVVEELLHLCARNYLIEDFNVFLETLPVSNRLVEEGKAELIELFSQLDSSNGGVKMYFSPYIVRGLDYYTGMIFETYIVGQEGLGSISSGGRYADLAGRFCNKMLPGVGASIGITRLFTFLKDNKLLGLEDLYLVDCMFMVLGEEQRTPVSAYADLLRSAGVSCEVYLDGKKKFEKQLKYAIGKKVKYVLILEQDGSITLKNMGTREQKKFDSIDLVVKEML